MTLLSARFWTKIPFLVFREELMELFKMGLVEAGEACALGTGWEAAIVSDRITRFVSDLRSGEDSGPLKCGIVWNK